MFGKDNGNKAANEHGIPRSSRWNKVRKEHLKIEPGCRACKQKKRGLFAKIFKPVQVHHVWPFHICVLLGRTDLELDERNLITLCESGDKHHITIGHLGDFQSYNPNVREHAEVKFLGMTDAAIKRDSGWLKISSERPKDFRKMTDDEKKVIRDLLDQRFPLKI